MFAAASVTLADLLHPLSNDNGHKVPHDVADTFLLRLLRILFPKPLNSSPDFE